MAEVHVAHEADGLEHLEVAIGRGDVAAAGELLGAQRPVGGEERIEQLAARGGDPQPALAQSGSGGAGVSASTAGVRRETVKVGPCGERSAAPSQLQRGRSWTVIQSTFGTAWAVRVTPTATMAIALSAGSTASTGRARAAQARGDPARRHDEQPKAGQRCGQAGREGDDEDHAQADLVLGDRAEEHDERRRARDEPGRCAHRQQRARRRSAWS